MNEKFERLLEDGMAKEKQEEKVPTCPKCKKPLMRCKCEDNQLEK